MVYKILNDVPIDILLILSTVIIVKNIFVQKGKNMFYKIKYNNIILSRGLMSSKRIIQREFF